MTAIPRGWGERFVPWTTRLLATSGAGDRAENDRVTREFATYISSHLDDAHDQETVIGTMIYHIATVDGLRDRLIADPALIPSMIDESLRMDAPVVYVARTVRGGADLAGQTLEDAERVLLVLSSANHDSTVFDRPEEFVCPRSRNPRVAFGSGVHRCLGEHLALLEMCIVAEELLAMAPRYRIADGYRPEWTSGPVVRGLTTLPVTFN